MKLQNYTMETEIQDLRAKTADMFDHLLKEYRCLKSDNEELKGALDQIADVITNSGLPPKEKRTPSQMLPGLMAELRNTTTPAVAPTKQDSIDTSAIEEKMRSTGRCSGKIECNVNTPLKQEKKKMGNWEAFAMDEAESTLCESSNENKVRQGSGHRSMELSPLMKTIPSNIEEAAATAKEIPKLVPAVKDVLTAAERLYNIITENDQLLSLRTIDDFLIKYAEFEPWSVYCTAFALLMDRCWSKNAKNEEKED